MRKKRYTGKYMKAGARWGMPAISVLLICAAVLAMLTGGVVAYLSATFGSVDNTFEAASSTNPSIAEEFDGSTKSNVKVDVGNSGYAVFVRAAVVVTWKDGEGGNVLGEAPVAGTENDYTISYNTTDWFQHGDFWYCKKPVNSGASTPVLITSCAPNTGKTPDGYGLNVEIIAQTIQALGTTDTGDTPAVTDAWGITVENPGTADATLKAPTS